VLRTLALLAMGCLLSAPSYADTEVGASGPVYTLKSIKKLDDDKLKELFTASPAGPVPTGNVAGSVIRLTHDITINRWLVNQLWSGKIFHAQQSGVWKEFAGNRQFVESSLHNLVGGHRMFKGEVYRSTSLLDGKPCWVIDYRNTSQIIGHIRDEFRHVGHGLYLGWAYNRTRTPGGEPGRVIMLNFALSTQQAGS
jgi:hypothetical protein